MPAFMDPETYNQVFTMHGSMMLFLFAIPMVEGMAVYLTPKILGTRDFAFPRLTAYGYWCYLFGGTILTVSLLAGVAPDGGWFMYTPLSSNVYTPGHQRRRLAARRDLRRDLGADAGVEIVVSILKMRAPGMSLDRMPIFGWYILVTAMMMVVAFPPLILGSILLEVERAFGLPFFDPTRGGDPLLWQHLFWLFGHPDVYIIFLPMAAVLSTIIPVFANRPLVGYRAIVVAIIALAFLSFGIWVHHMFTVGIPHLALAFFSAGSAIVAVPTAVQIFAWLATLAHGRPRWDVPMLYVFGFFFIFVLGGLTGVMLAMVPFDWQAHDTYFVVAHLHYVVAGALAFPMLAALYYWLPLLTGRTAVQRLVGARLLADLHRLQPDLLHDAPDWPARHAPAHLHLSRQRRLELAQPAVLGRRFHHDDRLRAGGDRPRGAAALRAPRAARSLERDDAGMGDADPAGSPMPSPRSRMSAPRPNGVAAGGLALSLARGEGYLGFARNGWQETLGVHMTIRRARATDRAAAPDLPAALTALATAAAVLAHAVQVLSVWRSLAALVIAGLFVFAGAARRPCARLRSDARRPWRQRAAAYRGGRSATVARR